MEDQNTRSVVNPPDIKKARVYRNVLVISIAFFLNFTSFGGLAFLQSSLHHQQGMGVINSSIAYGFMALSAIFLPGILIAKLGHKWTMCLSFIGYILWMVANGYAVWGTMATASVILGLFSAPLWTSQSAYFTIIGKRYAHATKNKEDVVITKLFGLFFMIDQMYGVTGSVISSVILREHPTNISEDVSLICGAHHCPNGNHGKSNITNPYQKKVDGTLVWILVGVYIAIACVAFLLVALFVDNLSGPDLKKFRSPVASLTDAILNLKQKKQLALIPISMYSGIQQVGFGADFLLSYVTCALGISKVGLVTIPFAVTSALMAYACSIISAQLGRRTVVLSAVIVGIAIEVTLILWMPSPDEEYVLYIISALWGFKEGIIMTQINALYGSTFPDAVEAGFANHQTWKAFGKTIAYAYSFYLCTAVKLYILLTLKIFLTNYLSQID